MNDVPVRRPLADRLRIDVGSGPIPPGWIVRRALGGTGLEFARSGHRLVDRRWIVGHHSMRRTTRLVIGPRFDRTYESVAEMVITHALWEPAQPFRSLPPGPIRGSSDWLLFVHHEYELVTVHSGNRNAAFVAQAERARSLVGAALPHERSWTGRGLVPKGWAALNSVPRAVGSVAREARYLAGVQVLQDPMFADDAMEIEQPLGLSAPIAATVLAIGRLMAGACGVPLYVSEEWTEEPSSGGE